MNKNWLIRTTQNKILGPISKEKLIEFIEKGSLTQSDEVTSGNGYWFYLHEQVLVDRYIVGNEVQGFNPISEGKTVLCRARRAVDQQSEETVADAETNSTMVIGQDLLSQLSSQSDDSDQDDSNQANPSAVSGNSDTPQILPKDEDLEFPDMDEEFELPSIEFEESCSVGESGHQTVVLEVDPPSESEDEAFEGKLPDTDDLEYPEISSPVIEAPELTLEKVAQKSPEKKLPSISVNPPPQKPIRQRPEARKNDHKKVEVLKTSRSDRYLFYVFFIMISLVAYAIYFYYSKISAHSPAEVGEELSSLIINSAQAQDGLQKKNNLAETFVLKSEKLSIDIGIAGARLNFSAANVSSLECKTIDEFSLLLQYFMADSTVQTELRNFVIQCPQLLSEEGKLMLEASLMDKAVRLAWLKSQFKLISADDRRSIEKIDEFRKSKPLLKEAVTLFNQYIELLSSSPGPAKLYRMNEVVLSFCQKNSDHSILAQLLEVAVALSVENQAWAKRRFSQLLQRNLFQIAFHLDPSYFNNEIEQKRYENNMRRVMAYIVERLHDQMLAKLAINYFAVFDQSDVTLAMLKKTNSEWSLADVRRLIENKINGQFFFIPWYYILQNRALEQEVDNFVRSKISISLIQKLGLDLIPILLKYFPTDDAIRNELTKLISASFSSDDLFHQYMIIQALKMPYLYKALSPLPSLFRGANFQLERQVFKHLLEDDGIVSFSLFNLIRLGETRRSLLWWLVI